MDFLLFWVFLLKARARAAAFLSFGTLQVFVCCRESEDEFISARVRDFLSVGRRPKMVSV